MGEAVMANTILIPDFAVLLIGALAGWVVIISALMWVVTLVGAA
jgi:hypothetical protein